MILSLKNIYVVGDIHADWDSLNKLITDKSPEIILSVGDFGFWSHFHNTLFLNSNKNF